MRATAFEKTRVEKIYSLWAPVYDVVFGAVFEQGRCAVVAAVERVGGRILEVGVGTGISLPYYSRASRVFGIDLSQEMLSRARERVSTLNLAHVEGLAVMDAEELLFPDESFDVVTAQCVVNTVPHPEVALNEFARVLKPGGEIILLNRVGAETGTRLIFERLLQPITSRLGWRSDFPWERLAAWLRGNPDKLRLLERRPVPPFGHFSLIRFTKPSIASLSENHYTDHDLSQSNNEHE
jgi:phosphatidylethanolamine/phosphatidyl-N-methylethanolamine N-methyltransferase